MGEPDVKALRRRLGRDELNRWYVAYHELHLGGAHNAAIVAAAVHNELMPLYTYFDLDWEPKTPEQMLPQVLFGDAATPATPDDHDAEIDRLLADAEAAYGRPPQP